MVTIPEDSRYGLGEVCGTPCYIAPEVLRHKGYREKADLFSIGSVFFNLLTGMYLFEGLDNEVLLAENKKCNIDRLNKYLLKTPHLAVDLFKRLVEADPNQRFNAREALAHPWFFKERPVI